MRMEGNAGGMAPYGGAMGGMNLGGMAGGLGGLLGGLFGNSAAPYDAYGNAYGGYAGQAVGSQQPFYGAGQSAIPQYQQWLQQQSDPSGFINHLMGQYQESPYAKYLQQQGMRAGTNAASASGMTGSTPFAQQMQQNSAGIASGDMQNWLNNALGVNTQYGQGLNNEVGWGQHSADNMSNTYNQEAQNMGQAAYGSQAGHNQDFNNALGGAMQIGLGLFGI